MLLPAYLDKAIFDRYVEIVEANARIKVPGNFHDWVFRNYARVLAVTIRKMVDTDSRAISLRRLIGCVAYEPNVVTRRAFLGRCPAHFRDLAHQRWVDYCGGDPVRLPADVAHEDLKRLKTISDRVVRIVNKEVVHHERGRRYRMMHIGKAHALLDHLHSLLAKYGDLCGRSVAYPYCVADLSEWERIFEVAWIGSPSN
ncbi:MAG: hypothetical protein KAI24_22165 [Planctomycetes bacterium]|nr:hypothetical protein [Planctomycetota bacterium]